MKHKVNKKVLRRTLSLILVMIMLVTGLNLDVKVEYVYATQKAEKQKIMEKSKIILLLQKMTKHIIEQ